MELQVLLVLLDFVGSPSSTKTAANPTTLPPDKWQPLPEIRRGRGSFAATFHLFVCGAEGKRICHQSLETLIANIDSILKSKADGRLREPPNCKNLGIRVASKFSEYRSTCPGLLWRQNAVFNKA